MKPRNYFQNQIEQNEVLLQKLKRFSLLLSMLRLVVILFATAVVYFFSNNATVVAVSIVLGLAGFLFLVARYTDVKKKKEYHQKFKALNQAELNALDGDFTAFNDGAAFLSDAHFFNQDIDLFGKASIFQHINRTGTIAGEKRLADKLNSNDINEVEKKQAVIKELSELPDWRQDYFVTTSMIENEVASHDMVDWMRKYKNAIPQLFSLLPTVFAITSLVILGLYGMNLIAGKWVLFTYLAGLSISGLFVKKVNKLYNEAGKMKDTLSQYKKLIAKIESKSFVAEHLIEEKKKLETEGTNASDVIGYLSKHINNLDQRNNIFFAFIANGFILWDLRHAYRIEKWMKDYEASIDKWFSVVAEFDAVNSLANYAFVHANYTYPQLSTSEMVIEAIQLGHPLLRAEQRVDNDLSLKDENFFIITGANMAGKSTFLRTVALNLVMANTGLPVCAKTYAYRPIKLISSMRTSDSLQDDESYFFSELKRLKFIIDEMEKDTYFIILDEILKGTNSKDKAEGSKKFVERLVSTNSTGLIATHDLSLCVIADESAQVENHYFDAQIVNDDLYFDYTFKAGVCQNMNASFLLKKMGIVE